MKYVIRHSITKRYVCAVDVDCVNFEYKDGSENATVFDSEHNPEESIFEDNPDRLVWQIRPLVMKFAEMEKVSYTELENNIILRLNGAFLDTSMFVEDVLEILSTNNTDIKDWVKRNFKHLPKVGNVVCYHAIIDGVITSRGHTITAIDKINRWAWITDHSGCVSFEAISEDMDSDNHHSGF